MSSKWLVSDGLGDLDQTFAWLDRAIGSGSVNIDDTELLLNDLRGDPRFARIRERWTLQ